MMEHWIYLIPIAASILKRKGFKEVHNLGSWRRLQDLLP
jgi:hypothetical protein